MSGRVYFAHSLRDYGSRKERTDSETISRLCLARIVNPNGLLERNNWFEQAKALIDSCQSVVSTEWQGYIGRGVWEEIEYALDNDKSVFILRNSMLLRIGRDDLELVNDSWVYYGKVRGRQL